MNERENLNNAPEGETHIEDNSNLYIKVLPRVTSTIFNDWFIFEIDQWIIIDTYNVLLMRSLSDIKRIVELEDLVEDIINAESADEKLRLMMFHVWLFKAKALKEPKAGRGFFIMKEDGQWEPKP